MFYLITYIALLKLKYVIVVLITIINVYFLYNFIPQTLFTKFRLLDVTKSNTTMVIL